MQQKILHKKLYVLSKIDETEYSEIALERKQKLEIFETLINEGCSEQAALEAIGYSRAKYYRLKKCYRDDGIAGLEIQSRKPHHVRKSQWSPEVENKVRDLRKKFHFWGKEKIAQILKRDHGISTSISTVGRILSKLIKKGKIKTVAFYTGKYIPKPRTFNDHAQRLPAETKSQKTGELVQIDHMTVKLHSGMEVKHFDAICPRSKFLVSKAYRQATSLNASDFLDFVIQSLPFPLISIQVDGGSEFMGEFERASKSRNIPLFVIPPRSPQINGSVERSNGTVKYEFYSQYDKSSNLTIINDSLKQFMQLYNNYRPHRGLQGLTPMEYYKSGGRSS